MRRRVLALPVLVVPVLAVSLALTGCGSDPADEQVTDSSGVEGVSVYTDLARDHVESDVEYEQAPPVGGDHDAEWLDCTGTVYDEPVRDEQAVHSMEHGAVWVTYTPDLPADQVATLAGLVEGTPYSFLSPYPGVDSPVVLTAWGLQLGVDSADDPRVAEFVSEYANGPQTPEPGATCEGGVETDDDHSE